MASLGTTALPCPSRSRKRIVALTLFWCLFSFLPAFVCVCAVCFCSPPFKRISMLDGLKEHGLEVPLPLESEETRQYLIKELKERGIECAPPHTTAR